jgi:hypothetical protein
MGYPNDKLRVAGRPWKLAMQTTSKFRFTIREIVLLTLVVGLALGWWIDHRRLSGPHSMVMPGDELYDVTEGLNPGDKVVYELLPSAKVRKEIVRRR